MTDNNPEGFAQEYHGQGLPGWYREKARKLLIWLHKNGKLWLFIADQRILYQLWTYAL